MPQSTSSSSGAPAPTSARRVDDHIGGELGVTRPYPGDQRRCGVGAVGQQAVDDDAVGQGHAGRGESGAAQDPLEGDAPAGDGDQLVVARERVVRRHARRQQLGEAQLGRTGRHERVEHVGRPISEQVAQAGEEGVRVPHLRRAPAVPLVEGVVGALGNLAVVALDDGDLVAGPAQRQRRPEARHAAADDDDAHGA